MNWTDACAAQKAHWTPEMCALAISPGHDQAIASARAQRIVRGIVLRSRARVRKSFETIIRESMASAEKALAFNVDAAMFLDGQK